jgi:hypothetical protein
MSDKDRDRSATSSSSITQQQQYRKPNAKPNERDCLFDGGTRHKKGENDIIFEK